MTTELARLQHFGPNWFASVMGTGIVATAGATLPVHIPGLHVFARVVWVVAAVLLVRARHRGDGATGSASVGGTRPRAQPADGALLRRRADGTDDGRIGRVVDR